MTQADNDQLDRKTESTGVKILLVEDNAINQMVAENYLARWGYHTECATEGKKAVDMIRTKQYKLVLMDLQMPDMDGYETAQLIRELGGDVYFKSVPIIALTASTLSDTKSRIMEAGMNDIVTKPFEPGELKKKIDQYVNW